MSGTIDLEARRLGIGGSDVAPILGLSPWKSPLDVYLEKRGEAEPTEDSEPTYWGRTLEDIVLAEYTRRTGREIGRPEAALVHPQYGFMRANLDAMTLDKARVVEAKCARTAEGWGEDGSDEVPDAYALQVQHYMLVAGCPVADFAVLIGGSDFRILTVEADAELQAMLINVERAFWESVIDGTPPAPRTYSEAAKAWRRPAESIVHADSKVLGAIEALGKVREEIKALSAKEDAYKLLIAEAIGDAGDTLVYDGKTVATWKVAKGRATFDAKALRPEYPEIADQFTKTGEPSRRLLIK